MSNKEPMLAVCLGLTQEICFLISGYDLPWEENFKYPHNFALPLEVAIEASNGASDYGNKFGEPVICGFARSFGMLLPDYERREWIKPIMFSGGIGSIDGDHVTKKHPQIGNFFNRLFQSKFKISKRPKLKPKF